MKTTTTRTSRLLVLLLSILFLLLGCCCSVVSARERSTSSGFHSGATREEILANRLRRKKHLESLLRDSRQKLADHSTGKSVLDANDLASLHTKLNSFQRRLDTMEGDVDEREVQNVLKREHKRFQRDEERRRRRTSQKDEEEEKEL